MVAAGESYLRRTLEALLDISRHVLAKGFARAPSDTGRWRASSARWSCRLPRLNGWCAWPAIATVWCTSITTAPLYELLVRRRRDIEVRWALADWMADRVADE